MDTLLYRASTNSWCREVDEHEYLGSVPSMLSSNEKRMLHWWARELPLTDSGYIMDAGCFLGGSTNAFVTGLAKNPYVQEKLGRIHAYDMFIAPRDNYSLEMISSSKVAGDSVIEIFVDGLNTLRDFVMVHMGDFHHSSPPPGDLDILFVDICKSWSLNDIIIDRFFSHLIPGKSVLIQQDYNDQSCPWVNLTMAYYRDYFDYIADEHSSRIYIYKTQIPRDQLNGSIIENLDFEAKLSLMNEEIELSGNLHSRFFNAVTTAWFVFEYEGIQKAREYLSTIDSIAIQPWHSEKPYVDIVLSAMKNLGDISGLKKYQDNYFKTKVEVIMDKKQMLLDMDMIDTMRSDMAAVNCQSHTTIKYQDDILNLLQSEADSVSCDVIEIGCYLGGLTTQLSYACAALGKRLHVVDINIQYLNNTLHHMDRLGVGKNVLCFTGDLETFLSTVRFDHPPLLIVIDGDHAYDGVIKDINAILKYQPQTKHLVFHDFSLRYVQPELANIRVDKAIQDTLGSLRPILPFGSEVKEGAPLATSPASDGHFHELGMHEGAHIHLGF